jgi:FkbM family methyltransferase
VLDLGGHLGTFSLAAAALGCRVLCVEAAPQNVRLLRASVERNGFDQLLVVHGAATDHEGMLEFLPSGPWGTVANPSVARSPSLIQANWLAPVSVPALTVDALLSRLGWERVDVVKLDVEGSEPAALRGMTGLLSRPDAPILLYESNALALPFFGETPSSLTATLRQFGYRSYAIEPGQLVPTQLDAFQPENAINCLAMKGQVPLLAGWRVGEPRSREKLLQRLLAESWSPHAQARAYFARFLAEADATLQADLRAQSALRMLLDDPDAAVREAAARALSRDRWAASKGGSKP